MARQIRNMDTLFAIAIVENLDTYDTGNLPDEGDPRYMLGFWPISDT